MEPPSIPLGERYKSLGYSMLTILWWVGVWGLSETLITFMVKESLLMKLGIYLVMISSVFLVILIDPTLITNL